MFDYEYKRNTFFQEHPVEIKWYSVEDVLEENDPRYKKWRKLVEATPEAELARNMERQGLEDFKKNPEGYTPKTK